MLFLDAFFFAGTCALIAACIAEKNGQNAAFFGVWAGCVGALAWVLVSLAFCSERDRTRGAQRVLNSLSGSERNARFMQQLTEFVDTQVQPPLSALNRGKLLQAFEAMGPHLAAPCPPLRLIVLFLADALEFQQPIHIGRSPVRQAAQASPYSQRVPANGEDVQRLQHAWEKFQG